MVRQALRDRIAANRHLIVLLLSALLYVQYSIGSVLAGSGSSCWPGP